MWLYTWTLKQHSHSCLIHSPSTTVFYPGLSKNTSVQRDIHKTHRHTAYEKRLSAYRLSSGNCWCPPSWTGFCSLFSDWRDCLWNIWNQIVLVTCLVNNRCFPSRLTVKSLLTDPSQQCRERRKERWLMSVGDLSENGFVDPCNLQAAGPVPAGEGQEASVCPSQPWETQTDRRQQGQCNI